MASSSLRKIYLLLAMQRPFQRISSVGSTRILGRFTELLYSTPKDVRREKVKVGDFTYEWLIPDNQSMEDVIFYIHGGGFVFPLWNPERFIGGSLAKLTGMRAFLIEYRLAPEHPFPAALEDCASAYRWLIKEGGVPPEKVVFFGASAGGNLVVTTMLALRNAGLPLPRRAVSISPFVDFECRGSFWTVHDRMGEPHFAMKQVLAYMGSADPHNPLLSPLYADLRGLPPLLIQGGEEEMLISGIRALAECAQQAGVQVTVELYPGMWHFWHRFYPGLPEARQAVDSICRFIAGAS